MKYIHSGKRYVIFSAYGGLSHFDMKCTTDMDVKHAGFLSFENDSKSDEAIAYGKSTSLNCKSEPFDYDETNYIGIYVKNNTPIISNSKELLKSMGLVDIQETVWKKSEEGNYGECPVLYLGHPSRNFRADILLRD